MDHLARGQGKAIKLMLGVPANSELSIARVEDQEVWLGFGWLVGKGWVAYRGDDCYKWKAGGMKSATAMMNAALDSIGQ